MLKYFFAIAAMLPSTALTESYEAHKGVLIFTEAPCGAVIEALDAVVPPPPTDTERFFYGTTPWFEYVGHIHAMQGMAWGFMLGYDTARGGLNTDEQSTLERFRDACAKSPDMTGRAVLDAFVVDERAPLQDAQ